MPTDLTTAEKAEKLGLTRCDCGRCSLWYDNPEGAYNNHDEVDVLYAERFPEPASYVIAVDPSVQEPPIAYVLNTASPDAQALLREHRVTLPMSSFDDAAAWTLIRTGTGRVDPPLAPDYRAALEALVGAASAVTLTLANAAAAHGPVEDDQCRALLAALTHARKVLHGQ